MFKRILIPLDGSSRAELALPVAARIAQASGGSIHLLQVLNLSAGYDGGMTPIVFATEQSAEMEMALSTDYLKSVAASAVLAGIQTTTEVIFGFAAQYILADANAQDIDLIVLCSHGRTGFVGWVLGSVAHTLAHESTVPLLVLREGETALPGTDTTRPLCALVPLDGSELAEAALAPAAHLVAALAAPAQGALHLVQVVKIFPATAEEGFVSELNQEAIQRARTYLAQVTERLQTTMKELVITSSVELEKDVSSALIHIAEHEGKRKESASNCDLIAISTHGRSGVERWVMGSVTERILGGTKLPMLIVRPQKKGRDERGM